MANRVRALLRTSTPEKLAQRLGVSPNTIRKAATGKPSARLAARAEDAWKRSQAAKKGWKTRRYQEDEREAIQDEPVTTVPGYGPQKLARVLQEIRHLRGEVWTQHQDVKYTVKRLEERALSVDQALFEELERLTRAEEALTRAEFRLSPSETIEERLYKVKNIDREYRQIARQFNLSDRAVYSLYYSPPAGGTALA